MTPDEARREIRRLAQYLPENQRYMIIDAIAAPPPECRAVCPCCQQPCSAKHINQIHGVERDNHWGGPKY